MLRINPISASPKQEAALDRLLKQNRTIAVFQANKVYDLDEKNKVNLTHSIVVRQLMECLQERSYFVLPAIPFAHGGFGLLFDLDGIIDYHIEKEAFVYHKLPQELGPWVLKGFGQLTKIQSSELQDPSRVSLHKIIKEYELLRKSHHTRTSFFLGDSNHCYLLQKRLGHMDLYALLEHHASGDPHRLKLNLHHRLRLCSLLARALQVQVHEAGIIHCDFKPENIMLDLTYDSNALICINEVNIIDFGISQKAGVPLLDSLQGKSFFLGPECKMKGLILQPSLDVYSLGCVYWMLFGFYDFLGLDNAVDMEGLSLEDKQRITETIGRMTTPIANERIPLADVESFFKDLFDCYFPAPPVINPVKRKRCLTPSLIEQRFFSEMDRVSEQNIQALTANESLTVGADVLNDIVMQSIIECEMARKIPLLPKYVSLLRSCESLDAIAHLFLGPREERGERLEPDSFVCHFLSVANEKGVLSDIQQALTLGPLNVKLLTKDDRTNRAKPKGLFIQLPTRAEQERGLLLTALEHYMNNHQALAKLDF